MGLRQLQLIIIVLPLSCEWKMSAESDDDGCLIDFGLIKYNMQKQHLLSEIHLRNLQIIQNSPSARRHNRPPNSNRTLMKLYLTRQILEECLETLDIFKEILEDPVQKSKLIRDVNKNLQLKLYDEGAIIYNKGETSSSFYMVIKGQVSLCMPVFKGESSGYQSDAFGKSHDFDEQQIDTFGQGIGFGQAEFIHGKKRALVAKAKLNDTVVGIIEGLAFEEIIELYKQRVYFKKIEMFGKCPLLNNLLPYQLQFIVNNAKPITIPISKEIVRQHESAKSLYLITEGEVELRRNNMPKKVQSDSKYRLNSKDKVEDAIREKIKIKNIVVGVLEEGEFIGDGELAMNIPFHFTAYAKSQKVRLYICDERIILSQMTQEFFENAFKYYQRKVKYRQNKSRVYREVKSKLQKRMESQQTCVLSKEQIKIKRMIANRYVEDVPSAIGRLSPRQISKMVDIKYARMKSQPSQKSQKTNYLPQINMIEPIKILKANERSYSPLLKKFQEKHERKYTECDYSTPGGKASHSISYDENYEHEVAANAGECRRSQSNKPLLVFMKPFVKKVMSLHERLSQEYNTYKRQQKEPKNIRPRQLNDNFSVIEMRRVYEFVNKLKALNKS